MTSSRKLPDLPPAHAHARAPTEPHTRPEGGGAQRACAHVPAPPLPNPLPRPGRGRQGARGPSRAVSAAPWAPLGPRALAPRGRCRRRRAGSWGLPPQALPRKGSTAPPAPARPPLTCARLSSGLGRSERVLPRGAFPTESGKVGQTLREPHKGGRVLRRAASGKRCERAA